jgi:N-acetylglucosaminyl-diphospho-decaprenol L-rhamnosyltransferase
MPYHSLAGPIRPSTGSNEIWLNRVKLLVVIVNFRVAHLAIDCLHSVAEEIWRVPDTHVAVCENGTGDDSAQRIQNAIDEHGWANWCTLTALDVNLGFTGGNNAVLRPALQSANKPQYFLLLNADTIVRPNAFKALADFMDQNPKVGIAGSRLEDPDGTPQQSAFRFQSAVSEFERNLQLGMVTRLLHRWVVTPPVENRTFETDWVAGASMIIRREVFEDIGLLDEGYYTYFDDIDFCFNARKKGWPTWYVPNSRVVHLVGQSTGVSNRPKRFPPYVFEARRRYFLKNHGPLYAAMADACMITGLSLWRLRALMTGSQVSMAPHLLSDSIRHSVFVRGFKLQHVQNPAFASTG